MKKKMNKSTLKKVLFYVGKYKIHLSQFDEEEGA